MTQQEHQIIRELPVIYALYGCSVWGIYMVSGSPPWDWGTVPQWVTAVVAVIAALVAATGIAVNWWLARKRAAIDFFLKTEADKELLDSFDRFWDGIRCMNSMPVGEFCTTDDEVIRKHYFAVRRYLNVHELLAVGIKTGMFDGWTCYTFWAGILIRCVEAARPVLESRAQAAGP